MKRQLTKHQRAIKRVARHTAYGHQKTKGDWQIEMRAFLDDIGWRQIDGDAFRWQRQPDGSQRRADPFTRFRHRLVGQPNDGHRRKAVCQMNLHLDRNGIDAAKGHRLDAGMHGGIPVL